jgi:hypothetical protein
MTDALYNAHYYPIGCGRDCSDPDFWFPVFERIADHIIQDFAPRTVLDAGCACGCLVAALRDRGVDAFGIDISRHAVLNARDNIKQYCSVCSLTDQLQGNFPGKFDLITCIEVLGRMCEDERDLAVENLCKHTDNIIFSSTPGDLKELTHFNVQQQEYWAKRFAVKGFYNQITYSANYISPVALYFKRSDSIPKVIEDYERNTRIIKQDLNDSLSRIKELTNQNLEFEKKNSDLSNHNFKLEKAYTELKNYSSELEKQNVFIEKMYQGVILSKSWRITKPIRSLLDQFKKKFRHNDHLQQKNHGNEHENVETVNMIPINKKEKCKDKFLLTRHNVNQIDTIILNGEIKRLNLVTDSIESHLLLGGVATAIILATEYCNRFNYKLRIITIQDKMGNANNYKNIIKMSNLNPVVDVSFFSNYGKESYYKLDLCEGDIFMATSWWSAMAITNTLPGRKFFYIIQEVETYFYPQGTESYLCSSMMRSKNIFYIVNSHYLYEYFKEQETNIVNNGTYFDPAFPATLYRSRGLNKKNKYTLFFYARPNNPRNLFEYGVMLIEKAITSGIIDVNEWEICCVGQDFDAIILKNGFVLKSLGQMEWYRYSEFLSDVDLAITLMYTPHPSYPPFDVASSGGVVISNIYQNKKQFIESKNVILTELDEESFMGSLKKAIELAKDFSKRRQNYKDSKINRDWHSSLAETVEKMGDWIIR